jgi:hypothetical protein
MVFEKSNKRNARVLKIYPTLVEIQEASQKEKGSFFPTFLFLVLIFVMAGFVGFVSYDLNLGITGYAIFGGNFKIIQDDIVEGFTASGDMALDVNNIVKSIEVKGLKNGDEVRLRNVGRALPPEGVKFSKVFAVAHNLAYDKATFTDTGYGTLYKCQYFDESDLCLSSWKPVRQIDGVFEESLDNSGYAIEGEFYKYPRKQIENVIEEPVVENVIEETPVEEIIEEEPQKLLKSEVPEGEEKIGIIDSSCVFKKDYFEVCATAARLGGEYGKIQISGGKGLKQIEKETDEVFTRCEEFDNLGKKAINAYLFDEKDKLIKQQFGVVVVCKDEIADAIYSESFVKVGYQKGQEEILQSLPKMEEKKIEDVLKEAVEEAKDLSAGSDVKKSDLVEEKVREITPEEAVYLFDYSCVDLNDVNKYYYKYAVCNPICEAKTTKNTIEPMKFVENIQSGYTTKGINVELWATDVYPRKGWQECK